LKYLCLNFDACAFVQEIPQQDLTEEKLQNPFSDCPKCNYLVVLVPNDFNYDESKYYKRLISIIKEST
jgi:hypothetical protein